MSKKKYAITSFYTSSREFNWIGDLVNLEKSDKGVIPSSRKDWDILLLGDENTVPDASLYCDENRSESVLGPIRDRSDITHVKDALRNRRKIIALGRSANLMCAASGGLVIGRVVGHKQWDKKQEVSQDHTHNCYLFDEGWMLVPSCHNQMMYPFSLSREKFSLLGWELNLSMMSGRHVYFNKKHDLIPLTESEFFGDGVAERIAAAAKQKMEPEIVFFRETNALCFAYNPMDLIFMINHLETTNKEVNKQSIALLKESLDKTKNIVDLFLKEKL